MPFFKQPVFVFKGNFIYTFVPHRCLTQHYNTVLLSLEVKPRQPALIRRSPCPLMKNKPTLRQVVTGLFWKRTIHSFTKPFPWIAGRAHWYNWGIWNNEMMTLHTGNGGIKNVHLLLLIRSLRRIPCVKKGAVLSPWLSVTFLQCIHSLPTTCQREREQKIKEAITKMVEKQSAVHLHLGHRLLPPAADCSHALSRASYSHYHCREQQVVLEWETRRRRHRGVLQCSCEGKLCIYTVCP